jgi:hypothetical protein
LALFRQIAAAAERWLCFAKARCERFEDLRQPAVAAKNTKVFSHANRNLLSLRLIVQRS